MANFAGYTVGVVYDFKSNAVPFFAKLSELTKSQVSLAESLTVANTEVSKSFNAVGAAMRPIITQVDRASGAYDAMAASMRNAAYGAGRSARTITVATEGIGDTSVRAAEKVADSTAVMSRRYAMVSESASAAAAAMRGVSAASVMRGGSGGGGGGAALAESAAAGGAGGALARLASGPAGIAGLAALATTGVGIHQAGSLQDAATQVAVAMGISTDSAMSQFAPVAMKMSQATAQSQATSMALLRVMATSGINDPKEMIRLAPDVANFADTQFLGKNHVAQEDSVALATKVAHQMGARTSAQLRPILNTMFKMSQDMPDSLKDAATQLKYYAPIYQEHGVSPTEILKLQATADRLGYGAGKSGTGFYQIYRNLLNPDKYEYLAQKQLGITNFVDPKGNLNIEGLLNKLHGEYDASRRAGKGRAFDQMLQNSFSSNAALIASVMSSDAGRTQYKSVGQTMNRVQDLEKAQAQLLDTLNNKTGLLVTNFQTLAGVIGGPLIKPLTDVMTKLANVVGGTATYLSQHPAQRDLVTAGFLGGSGIGLIKAAEWAGVGGIFARVAEHSAKHSVGIGGWLRFRPHGTHRAAVTAVDDGVEAIAKRPSLVSRLTSGIWDHFTLGHIRRMPWSQAIGRGVGNAWESHGLTGANLFGHLDFLKPLVERLGSVFKFFAKDAFPVIGEVLLLAQGIQFLGTHSKEIGKILGNVAHWIVKSGVPLVMAGFKILFDAIVTSTIDLAKWIAKGIWDSLHGHGFFDWAKSVYGTASSTFAADDAADAAKKTANDHAYLAREHQLARDRVERGVTGGKTAGASRRIKTSDVATHHHHYKVAVEYKADPSQSSEHHARALMRSINKTGMEAASGSIARGGSQFVRIGVHKTVNAH